MALAREPVDGRHLFGLYSDILQAQGTPEGMEFVSKKTRLPRLQLTSSGWPPGIESRPQREAYLEMYRRGMDIDITYDDVSPNSSIRFISKLILNSLCELPNLPVITLLTR